MKQLLLVIGLLLTLGTNSMAQPDSNKVYFSDLETFQKNITPSDKLTSFSEKEYVVIKNSKTVLHTSWGSGDELPENGVFFDDLEVIIKNCRKLKELRLVNLFVKELPDSFSQLSDLSVLEICFSRSADVNKNLSILKKLPHLEYLDLNGSRLSEKQRDFIRIELKKSGVFVNDVIMLQSN